MKKEPISGKNEAAVSPMLPPPQVPFTVPDGYFDNLTDSINKKVDLLEGVPGDNKMYEVPTGYFESLPHQIIDRIQHLDSEPKVVSIRRKTFVSKSLSIAAVISFVMFIYKLSFPHFSVSSNAVVALTPNEITNSYLFEDLDESLITEASIISVSDEAVHAEELNSYLIENHIDLNTQDIEI